MRSKRIASIAWKVLIVGILVLVFFIPKDHTPDLKIMCDNERMSAGDTCISTSSSLAGTYEERVRRELEESASAQRFDDKWGLPLTILGGTLVAGSVIGLAVGLTGMYRARRSVQPADQGWWVDS